MLQDLAGSARSGDEADGTIGAPPRSLAMRLFERGGGAPRAGILHLRSPSYAGRMGEPGAVER